MQNLVIVESPTKARTLSKFLGTKYRIEASMGHIRDLPKAEIGVDIEADFEPKYIVPRDKTKRVNELKKIAASVNTLWLATDPDREGEAIAWHLAEILKIDNRRLKVGVEDRKWNMEKNKIYHLPSTVKKPSSTIYHPLSIKRVVFHEITEDAVKEAFESPRSVNLKLVDAQQARRVLDRLVGYKLSPLLWQKVKSGLSAGRVQSVTLRLIVEREKEIEKFKPQEYWSIDALVEVSDRKEAKFQASLAQLNGKKLSIKNKGQAESHLKILEKAGYKIDKITKKELKKYPYPPFTTSTLQQTASSVLGFTARKTMSTAQYLYEQGLITYMRTDSVNLSTSAISAAREFIKKEFGQGYLPSHPRIFKTKSRLAQEAHEAIRPTNVKMKGSQIRSIDGVRGDHIRLYDLIWKSMVASQMKEAVLDSTSIGVQAKPRDGADLYALKATGSVIKFEGWMKLYGKEAADNQEKSEQVLPQLKENELLTLLNLIHEQHFTEPPSRYTEATLIKKLEELGIGRPSTYAPIISTIQERFYVEKQERKFMPTPLGTAVTEFLTKNFADTLDYTFTASMEDALDDIAKGEKMWRPVIGEFYKPFEKKLGEAEKEEKVKLQEEKTDKTCPKCGKNLVVKFGKFGKFLACSGFPECKHTEPLVEELGINCPECKSGRLVTRRTKKGRPFYGCSNWPTCKFASWNKPK